MLTEFSEKCAKHDIAVAAHMSRFEKAQQGREAVDGRRVVERAAQKRVQSRVDSVNNRQAGFFYFVDLHMAVVVGVKKIVISAAFFRIVCGKLVGDEGETVAVD